MSTDDATADFARLQGTAEQTASNYNQPGGHPIFSAIHSFVLAHRYGYETPMTYMNNPGLRAMDTRDAAFRGLQNMGAGINRWRADRNGTTTVQTPQPGLATPRPYGNVPKPQNPLARRYAPFKNP